MVGLLNYPQVVAERFLLTGRVDYQSFKTMSSIIFNFFNMKFVDFLEVFLK